MNDKCMQSDNAASINALLVWRQQIKKHTEILDRISNLFGFDNDVIEHLDWLAELYTRAIAAQCGLDDDVLFNIWLEGFEFNEDEYQLFIKKIGE